MRFIPKITLVLFFLFLFLPQKVEAIYDPLSIPNNKFGIHILETSELSKAAELVNSSGGDWGYVTIPIRANERDREKWTNFMDECRKLHLIPILRIAQYPKDGGWAAPNEWDLVDFSNFLNELPWPVRNRYVIVYNEPNHQGEWGGFVYPEEYARVLSRAVEIFHEKNQDFFVISAGFDSSAPNGSASMNVYQYMSVMEKTVPGIFSKADGFSAHAYGNPAFSTPPNPQSRVNIASYRYEINYLSRFGLSSPKIFITEAGWGSETLSEQQMANYYLQAFNNIWTEQNIVAITPFLLQAHTGPFSSFSFLEGDGKFKSFAEEMMSIPKVQGKPSLATVNSNEKFPVKLNLPESTPVNPKLAQPWERLIQILISLFDLRN